MQKFLQMFKRVTVLLLRRVPFVNRHPRLKGQMEKIISACNMIFELRSNTETLELDAQVGKMLIKFGINFSALPVEERKSLYAIFGNANLSNECYEQLKDKIQQLPNSLLSCKQWLNLHEMCCYRGRYSLANLFREKARLQAIEPLNNNNAPPPISWSNTIGAAIEGGECCNHRDLELLLNRAEIFGDVAKKWHLYLAVIIGEDISPELIKTFDQSDFADFIEGKSVVIVGPAPTIFPDAEKIDDYDIVVRLNHSFDGKGTDSKFKGLRTNITCFNGEQCDALISERAGKLPLEVTWACFKPPADLKKLQKKNPYKKIRNLISFHEAESTQFHGFFNMMPIVALDFALFNVEKINIYHTDLMLTLRRHAGYYPKSFDYDERMREIFLSGSINHDPIQQFHTFSRLVSAKKVSGDFRFLEVINMGLDAYLDELERVYMVS